MCFDAGSLVRRNMEKLVSIAEAAEKLGGISIWTVRAWLSQGRLERTKVGNRTMIKESELEKVIQQNPFPAEAEADPRALHAGFLAAAPEHPDLKTLESLKTDSERFRLIGKVFYLHAPDGVGRSKLAAKSERLLGVPMTDRNWRTVLTLWNMAQELK